MSKTEEDTIDSGASAGSEAEEVPTETKKKAKQFRKKLTSLDKMQIHDQIIEALETLKERKGASLIAIKRYLEDNYKTDTQRQSAHIRKIIIDGVESGDIIRTRGVGAFGRFKIAPTTKKITIKKRKAPEDYQEIPAVKHRPKTGGRTKPGPASVAAKQKPTKPTGKAEEASPVAPKKRGRPAKK
ncbi:histone H1A, sperm-like [Uranotaenia lowii]|uniref:histone H1A, sperm-like n=1 Tax=Uranotaenia lowii TaxID=190385 RepID=UPI002479008C|nr:histone H1A, sperm-like [Uranotaenia lowii]